MLAPNLHPGLKKTRAGRMTRWSWSCCGCWASRSGWSSSFSCSGWAI